MEFAPAKCLRPKGHDAMTSTLERFAALIAGVLIASALNMANAHAEAAFSFAATPGKLPKTVTPLHYALDLHPDLDKLTIAGAEVVDIAVAAPTDRIVLNAVNMTVDTAAIEGDDGLANQIIADAAAETVTLVFSHTIDPGPHQLRVGFSAHINRFGRGLFVVDYPTDQGRKRMISSQLEPADARRIFPCWDEPAFKATFDLTVSVPETFLAVSNMPIAHEQASGAGRKRVTFARTPKMSSYLFVLAAGELERLSADAGGVAVGVVTTAGKSANGRFALDEAVALLKYYNDYFGQKYPLPKLDLIAVPGGFGGAMENWGGITFFESRLLFDPSVSSQDTRRGLFSVLAHEMAHQWFGDLVTMAWWDNLWLNEGFASWMQNKAAEKLHPEWQTWLNASGAKQGAMAEDARRTTHPIQQSIANESEAMTAFDVITYSKGQAFIRMLETFLGEDKFRAGIRQYMQDHALSNSTTADLWDALEAASGVPVTKIAKAFTEQPGVPLIVAEAKCVKGEQRFALRQDRFTVHDPDAAPLRWDVPVVMGPISDPRAAESFVLDGPVEKGTGRCRETVKLNLGDVGYYRVQYDPATQASLARSLGAMKAADRINLIADAWALGQAGRGPPASALELIARVGGDNNRAVWDQVLRILSRIDHLEHGRSERGAFQAYARSALRPVFVRIGWNPKTGETEDIATLRARLVGALGQYGDEAVLTEAKRRFTAFLKDPAALSADLREPVTHLVGRTADRATYDTLLGLARKTTNTSERVRYYSAAAGALDPALAKDSLAIALSDELPSSLVGTLILWVAGEHPKLAWDFVQENFDALAAKQGPSFRHTFASSLMTTFADRNRAAELARFAPVHETSGGRISAARAEERILTDADFVDEQLPAIETWIKRRKTRR
jgi:aminopeptidase N